MISYGFGLNVFSNGLVHLVGGVLHVSHGSHRHHLFNLVVVFGTFRSHDVENSGSLHVTNILKFLLTGHTENLIDHSGEILGTNLGPAKQQRNKSKELLKPN